MNKLTPSQFRVGDVARIKGLTAPDDIWNGTEVIIKSKPYLHKETGCLAINIEMESTKGLALSPWNLEKITEAEYDAYVDHRYLNPNGFDETAEPYDGRKVTKWKDCVWQPDPNFRKSKDDCDGEI